jgi:competence protein ComEC
VKDRLALHVPHLLLGALCAGIAAANTVRAGSGFVAVLAVAFASIAVAMPQARIPLLIMSLLLGGWWWGSVRLGSIDRSPLASQIGLTSSARVVVTGPARRSRYTVRVPARTERYADHPISEPVLLELPVGRSPPQGAVLELTGLLAAPRGPDDGFDERTWLRRHGIHAVLHVRDWHIVSRRGGLLGLTDRLRRSIDAAISSGVSGERRAVLLGIVLGEDEELDQGLRDDFRASGLYHLLAVSGSNVALVAGGVLLVAWLLGVPRLAAEVGALGAIGAYVLAVGAQPSVVRAGVAGALASLAWICARERDRWWFLLLGAFVLLAWNPYNLLDAGFQLSFAAVAAIFTVVRPLMRRLEGYPLPRPAAATIAVSTACGLATAPILLFQFGSVPAYSVASNALAAPVVAPLLGFGLASAALHPFLPDVAALLSALDGWLAAYLVGCARLTAGLPHARIAARPALETAAVVVAVLWFVAKSPARLRRSTLAIAALAAAVVVLVAWRTTSGGAAPPPPTGLRITFLDVGQGDGTLVQVPEGALLVDEGPPEADVSGQLRRLGVRSLSIVVLTHPQLDHIGGASAVLESTRVLLVLDPRLAVSAPEERAALAAARDRGVPIVTARPGLVYRIGRLQVHVLWPDGPGLPSEDPNNHAIVLLLSYGQIDLLLSADAESDVLVPLNLPPVEIIKVAHHGSADPLLPALLDDLRPRIAVISVGAGNSYGHPRPDTLAALGQAPGLAVYRTDEDGAVTIESDGRAITVATEH